MTASKIYNIIQHLTEDENPDFRNMRLVSETSQPLTYQVYALRVMTFSDTEEGMMNQEIFTFTDKNHERNAHLRAMKWLVEHAEEYEDGFYLGEYLTTTGDLYSYSIADSLVPEPEHLSSLLPVANACDLYHAMKEDTRY